MRQSRRSNFRSASDIGFFFLLLLFFRRIYTGYDKLKSRQVRCRNTVFKRIHDRRNLIGPDFTIILHATDINQTVRFSIDLQQLHVGFFFFYADRTMHVQRPRQLIVIFRTNRRSNKILLLVYDRSRFISPLGTEMAL